MAATLDAPRPFAAGDPLPPLWHWLYFLEAQPPSELGRDGHPQRGGFLPPVALPRRMWAGGRVQFHRPLTIGAAVEKTSTIEAVTPKSGRSGALCFVTVSHALTVDGALCLREEHDIVYREDPAPDAPARAAPRAPEGPAVRARVAADPTLLFRYSALTFNGHRIHYDRDYARDVEGYPDLVVHGPLIATLLAGHAVSAHPSATLTRFDYRAESPICGSTPFDLSARDTDGALALWAATGDGALAMTAEAHFA